MSKNGCGLSSSSIAIIIFLCVCFDVTYSGEYNVSDVTLSVYPGMPELGGQEGQPPLLPFTKRGRGGKGALSI